MVQFCANVSMLFAEVPFLERFGRARAAGFDAVEFQFPYDFDAEAIKAELDTHHLDLVLFNFPAGDFAAGDRGMANDPNRIDDFNRTIETGLAYARTLKPARMNCMAGKWHGDAPEDVQRATLIDNLRQAADQTAVEGILLVTEPLNPHDAPGFFLPTPSAGFEIVAEANHPNLKVEYDIYHAARTEGDIVNAIRENIDAIGHIQLADAPGRNEPGTGELNWRPIFEVIDAVGYSGRIGLEYKPSTERTEDSLGWMKEYA
jgi:hydroxypyruvate isomerase